MKKLLFGCLVSLFSLTVQAQGLGEGEVCADSRETAGDCYEACETGLFTIVETGEFVCVDLSVKLGAGEVCAEGQATAGDCYDSCKSGMFMKSEDGMYRCVEL